MDIDQFLTQCEGKWFSQRTCYQLTAQQTDNGKADLSVARLAATEPNVAQLGDRAGIPASELWGGLEMSWDTSPDWDKPKQVGSALLVLASEGDRSGRVLRATGSELEQGHYQINADESLTLTLAAGDRQLEERLWFAADNLRLRISTLQVGDRFQHVAFYSEIRRLPPKES